MDGPHTDGPHDRGEVMSKKNKNTTDKTQRSKFAAYALQCETDECIVWPYEYDRFYHNAQYITVSVFICERRIGGRQWDKQSVLRTCGNLKCCNYRHMEWATHTREILPPAKKHHLSAETVRDMRKRGLMVLDIATELRVPIEIVQGIMDRTGMRYL